MTDASGYTEDQLLNWMFKNTDMDASPVNVYVSLHTADEGENPDGSNEVSAADYDRASTAASDWTVDSNDGPSGVSNASDISFGDPQNNWGTITHFALWDGSADTDNPLIKTVQLSSSKTVDADTDELLFSAGDLTASMD